MSLAEHVRVYCQRVEVINWNISALCATSKEVASVWEPDLVAVLHRNSRIFFDTLREDVLKRNLVGKGYDEMESWRMEGNCLGFLAWSATCLDFKLPRLVVPNFYFLLWACDYQGFSQTDVHTGDLRFVEGCVDGLELRGVFIRAIESYIDFTKLIITIDVVNPFFLR